MQGTYSQDWLLYDTDFNWRIEAKDNGTLRAMGDIGSHWMDMIQHLTGLKINVSVRRSGDLPQDPQEAQVRGRDLRRQDAATATTTTRSRSTPTTSARSCCASATGRAARSR